MSDNSSRPGSERLRRWLWFGAIYAGSVAIFGVVTGLLALCLPK